MVKDIIAKNNLLIKQLTNDTNIDEMNKISENNDNYMNNDNHMNNNFNHFTDENQFNNDNHFNNTENNYNNNENLNLSGGGLSDSGFGENQLSQMSNMTERTKFLFKKTMDEYPPLEDDNFFNSIQSKNL